MQFFTKIMAVSFLILVAALVGCSSVTYVPLDEAEIFAPKPKGFDVKLVGGRAAHGYRLIGSVSCQDSAASSIWNWWTDQQALIVKMKASNEKRLKKKVREAGGDAIIGLTHDLSYGGSSGGVGLGVGVGGGDVGVGVGTSLLGGNPKIIVVSYGQVGVDIARHDSAGDDAE